MRLYGLIGYPLGHSFSAGYFAKKFAELDIDDCSYQNFPMDSIDGVRAMLSDNSQMLGFNITIPYKEQIFEYLDDVSAEAQAIGAVNCVRIDQGKLTGYNTDVYGFIKSLMALIGDDRPKALVLGTGGSSKAIKYALTSLGIDFLSISRTRSDNSLSYQDVDMNVMSEHKLIINSTPLGMYPNVDTFPALPYQYLTSEHFLFDLTYNPTVTRFLGFGAERGAKVKNGYDMLVLQAECSWNIWSARSASLALTTSSIGASPLVK